MRTARRKFRGVKTDQAKKRFNASGDTWRVPFFERGNERNVFSNREMRKKTGVLKYVADAATEMNGIGRGVGLAANENLAGSWSEQSIDELEKGGFSTAATTEQDEGFASGDSERNVRNDGTSRNIVYAITYIAEFDCRVRICVRFRHHFD